MPKAIDMMRRREKEILKTILHLSEKTRGFTNPELIIIGGYVLRAFISLSRFTRDCDFALRKKNGWSIDRLKNILPDYSVEEEQKYDTYGFLRCIKFVKYDKAKVKVSMDFMEGEIRGREAKEIIRIDKNMIRNRKFVSIPIAGKSVNIPAPNYLDYFIMKVVSSRASDVRDIASLVQEKGVPLGLEKRVRQILPHPEIFKAKLEKKIIPEIKRTTFLDSWKGIFGTTRYTEEGKKKVLEQLTKLIKQFPPS